MTKGQILPSSTFCDAIQSTISTYKPKNIVEIGTWKGLGSTKCIIDSILINNLQCNFLSLESNLLFFQEATDNLKNYRNYVQLIHGRIVEIEDVLAYCEKIKDKVNQDWLAADVQDINKNNNIINLIPNNIDFCLLDGGEYSTYPEWKILKERINIIALDDTLTPKCELVKQEILNDPLYKIIIESNDRNGFLIAIRN
jgi:hypothetical protein